VTASVVKGDEECKGVMIDGDNAWKVEVEGVDVRLRRVEHDQAETQPDPCPRHP
jgi:hypothetical protein